MHLQKMRKQNPLNFYWSGVEDPLTRLLGPERGGRSRTISNVIGRTKVKGGLFQGSRQQGRNNMSAIQSLGEACDYGRVDSSPSMHGAGNVSGGSHVQYQPIEEHTVCGLLFPYPCKKEILVGSGLVYPTVDRMLDEKHMEEGYVKVKVDSINPSFECNPLPPVSCYNDLSVLGDACGEFIQWPRFAIQLPNTETASENQNMTPQVDDIPCYEPQFEQPDELYHTKHFDVDPIVMSNFEDEFGSDGLFSNQHGVHVAEGLDALFVNEVPVEQPRSPKLSKLQQNIQTALLKIESERPETIRSLAAQLEENYGGTMSIQVNFLDGMYPDTECDVPFEYIEYEGMLQFLANGCLDVSLLHWCELSHWVLFIVSPRKREAWILDSTSVGANKTKDDYPLSRVIESSFGGPFTWTMVKDGSWECGYLVIWFMFEFVFGKRFHFPNNIWNDTRSVTQEEIDKLVRNIMLRFLESVFDVKYGS